MQHEKIVILICDHSKVEENIQVISHALNKGSWIYLAPHQDRALSIPEGVLPQGPGFILNSGGSSNGPHQCLHPSSHLDQSAIATGKWLKKLGINPQQCLILNALPLHHVSGLMPWWRSQLWGAKHLWMHPSSIKDPKKLETLSQDLLEKYTQPKLISLVPTQLQRLLSHTIGIKWLQCFSLIWIGGAALSNDLAEKARKERIRLAPCYGTTETAAMVSALNPDDFLNGANNCGVPLNDVELKISKDGTLKIKTQRLCKARWHKDHLEDPRDTNGWWKTEDIAKFIFDNHLPNLLIQGRKDTAIISGGETVYPENLEERLLRDARSRKLPLEKVLFIPIADHEWGQRIVGLISWSQTTTKKINPIQIVRSLVKDWLPAEKPIEWYECPDLKQNESGKWERRKWENWLSTHRR